MLAKQQAYEDAQKELEEAKKVEAEKQEAYDKVKLAYDELVAAEELKAQIEAEYKRLIQEEAEAKAQAQAKEQALPNTGVEADSLQGLGMFFLGLSGLLGFKRKKEKE